MDDLTVESGPLPLAAEAAALPSGAVRALGSTRSETLPISSLSSRLRSWRAVTLLPARPASGDVLIPSVTASEGSSTLITGSGRGSSGSASVSPIVTSASPATAMISPGPAVVASTRSSASVT